MDKKINVKNLFYKPYPNEEYILNNISADFNDGGFYGILGPNGSGKTTLIRHILRFLETKKGAVYIDKKNIDEYKRKEIAENISFVPQNVNAKINFSVYDVVAMGRNPYLKRFEGLTKDDKDIIEKAMVYADCIHLKDKIFLNLSGGESQRVLIARAIAQDTKYIILDEPISHLDIRYQVDIMETLKKLNEKENKTIIVILHDINLSASYCKYIFLMKDGHVFSEGPSLDVLTKENLKNVYDIDFEIYKMDDKNVFFVPKLNKK